MSTEINTRRNAYHLASFPYLMRYQLIGYSHDHWAKRLGEFVYRSPSITSFEESPANLRFCDQHYVDGFAWAAFHTLEVKASGWGPARHRLKNEMQFANARFDFRPARAAASGFAASGEQAVQPTAQAAMSPSSGFTIYLSKWVEVLRWVQEPDPFFDSQTIIFAYGHAHCSGNVPPHVHGNNHPFPF